MYAKNWTHPWNVRGAMNCATTNGQFVKGYVILYKWYYNRCWLGLVVLLVFETIGFMYISGCVCPKQAGDHLTKN